MTVLVVFSVRDRALDAFMQPFFAPSVGIAVRSFSDEVNRVSPERSPMNAHPEDYDLYEIGRYDDSTGELVPVDRRQVAVGKDVIRAQEGRE